jgi:hypothetical protein
MPDVVRLGAIAATFFLALGGGALAGGFDTQAIAADADLSSYSSVHVADVATSLERASSYDRSGSGARPVDADDAAQKAADLREALVAALSRDFSMASGPGAGILTIEATLTELNASRPTMGDYSREPSLGFQSVYAGGASVTIAFSEAGKPLGDVSDDYASTLGDGRPRIGIWDDADRAFESWARRLPDFIKSH